MSDVGKIGASGCAREITAAIGTSAANPRIVHFF
jgi:hypothetical protein